MANNVFPGGPHIKGAKIVFRPGLQLRLFRNLDKERGFVSGALGTVHSVPALEQRGYKQYKPWNLR